MSKITITLFYVEGWKESTNAFILLKSKGIDFLEEKMSSTTADFGKLPLLMVGDQKWEGMDGIQAFVDELKPSDSVLAVPKTEEEADSSLN